MEPLRITAHLHGAVCIPDTPIALDALLVWAACTRDGIPPAYGPDDVVRPEIPIAMSACGRYYLASFAVFKADAHELRYITKRAPVEQYAAHGDGAIKTVNITAGPNKSYRIPLEALHAEGDRVDWYCVGDRDGIEALLSLVHYLGKKRSVGLGKVERWNVKSFAPWGDDFPVALDGRALRTLPAEHPALIDPDIGYANLQPPYWQRETESPCALPLKS